MDYSSMEVFIRNKIKEIIELVWYIINTVESRLFEVEGAYKFTSRYLTRIYLVKFLGNKRNSSCQVFLINATRLYFIIYYNNF